ncbi:MAG: radical SAM protein [Methanobacteriota archaeon]|nr:MAG: radical SAM protein [Euryarchaeota archaeon]
MPPSVRLHTLVGIGMKVVLSTPPGKTTERWPPLGLLYIASSCLKARSDEMRVLDAFCENLSREQLVRRVVAEKPDIFGMNCSTHTFLDTIDTIKMVSEALPETKLVLGGFHATFAYERILKEYGFVDYVVRGEGEESFPRLLDCMERGVLPSGVPGIGYIENGRVISMDPVTIRDLDSLPFPSRELVDGVDYGYHHRDIRLTFGKFTTVSSSRGCPFNCAYCSCSEFSKRQWRPRSPENVVDELERLYDDGYECCVFVDDNFTLRKDRVEKLCDLIDERRIRMQFYCEGRVDEASYSLMRRMKKAGFSVIYFGVESPQKPVLDYYRKAIDASQARKAIEDAKKAGMLVVTSYIMGAPVESVDDMNRTVDFIHSSRPHGVQINILDCLIGTEVWSRLETEGLIGPDDWKRNHRIYEYNSDGMSRADLEALVNKGYAAHLSAWKSLGGLSDLARAMALNRTARDIVVRNLANPNVRRRLSDSRRFASVDTLPGR